ncbi:hypothetical protein [Parahaliea mediterranea]|uniref:DUF4426 domain-containing protein n=1 Tax=Parahaliea mediterranea TaxID=651086 RepID=A0A939DG29_9GAMM|nr:hypothetical protein [Parahaliea mediterranea]MBN7796857.1 hypothetical protein [Parahaliea mediterranea]
MRNSLGALLLGAAVGAGGALAQSATQETDWMELVKGYKGSKVGAELRDIQIMDDTGSQRITVAIPKSAIGHPDTMEEVRVVGRRPDKLEFEFPLEFTYEWVDDYDNDYYGLVLHLGKDSKVPFRLFMDSRSGFAN